MVERSVQLTTRFIRGYNARVATGGSFPDLTPGDGISIENGVISVKEVTGVSGTFVNPVITIDSLGRVSAVESGALPSSFNADVVDTPEEVATYSGDADALFVINAGNGRSAMYVKNEAGDFTGPAFITGERGPQGQDGANGADGVDGMPGERGPQGDAGPEGPQGVRGPAGEAGERGADGFNGEQGPEGPQGPQGPMGSFLTPNEYGNLDEDKVIAIQSNQGDYFFLVNPSGDLRANQSVPTGISGDMSLHLIGWNGSYFTDYGQLTGAQGPQGLQGVQGIQGERGPQGLQGERGLQGIAGCCWAARYQGNSRASRREGQRRNRRRL